MRLRSHLLVVSVLTLLPMAVFAIAGALLLAERERAAFQRGAIDSVRALMTAVDAELRSTVTTLEALSVLPQLDADDLESFRPDARRVLNTQPTWINLVITRPTGEHLLNLLVPPGEKPPPSRDHETVLRAAQGRRSVVGNMVSGAVLQRPVFTVRTPVVRDGKVKYVLSAVLEPRSMKALLDAQRIPDAWVAGIIDANHRFVARSHAPPGQTETVSATLKGALESGKTEGWMAGRTLEGVESYRSFARSTYSGWAVSIAMPRAVVFASSFEAAALLGFGVLLAMGAGVALAILIARRIASPIAELAASAPQLGHGEVDTFPHTNIREVRQLAGALHVAGKEIREREAELRMANRAKDEFLAMLGHELRNPLATISTAGELLRVAGTQPGVAENVQALISRQSAHMSRLVNDLLEAGRVTAGKIPLQLAPVNLAEVAARVVTGWRYAGRLEGHAFAESLHDAWVLADPARIEQIITNLLDNAVKYTPPGGRIEVHVRRDGESAVVQVVDEGQGIAPELAPRVFDLFVQGERGAAREQGGLGVGLTLVKRLTELQNGTAAVFSGGQDKGATFTVTFPAIEPPALHDAAADVARPAVARRVLVVEDNADARESLAKLLEILGNAVRTAPTGAEAIRLAGVERFDIAFIDIGLPDMTGYEVASSIRVLSERTPIRLVALTGYGADRDVDASRRAGFDLHLTKPAELSALERILAEPVPARMVTPLPRKHG